MTDREAIKWPEYVARITNTTNHKEHAIILVGDVTAVQLPPTNRKGYYFSCYSTIEHTLTILILVDFALYVKNNGDAMAALTAVSRTPLSTNLD